MAGGGIARPRAYRGSSRSRIRSAPRPGLQGGWPLGSLAGRVGMGRENPARAFCAAGQSGPARNASSNRSPASSRRPRRWSASPCCCAPRGTPGGFGGRLSKVADRRFELSPGSRARCRGCCGPRPRPGRARALAGIVIRPPRAFPAAAGALPAEGGPRRGRARAQSLSPVVATASGNCPV